MDLHRKNTDGKGSVTRKLRGWRKYIEATEILVSLLSALIAGVVGFAGNFVFANLSKQIGLPGELFIPLLIAASAMAALVVLFTFSFRILQSREEQRNSIYKIMRENNKSFFDELQKEIDKLIAVNSNLKEGATVEQAR
jgi:hypothetical protein